MCYDTYTIKHHLFNGGTVWLRKFADEAIDWYDGYANRILQIKAEDFVERIEKMPFDYIEDWLDGKNQLEWKPEWQRKEKQ